MLSNFTAKASCLLLLVVTSFIANAQLKANFSSTNSKGCAPLVVSYNDISTGSPNQWRWDLGNGTISLLKNPSVTYFIPGKYTVKLIIRNAANNEDSISKTDYITVNDKPTVQFSTSNTTGCYPLTVSFTDQSNSFNDTVVSWKWDFGDGVTSTQQNPQHVYTAGGNFNVTLQVKNSTGCVSTLSKTAYIQINYGTSANFSNSISSSCSTPVNINFNNLSTGTGVLSYRWLFGDGTESTAINPSHDYTTKGSYSVQLIVTNNNGCTDTITKKNSITVGTVNASFISNDSTCEKSTLSFTNKSTPNPFSVTWDFGDGTSSTSFNALKSYNIAGVYNVKMVANFGACSDSVTKKITVLENPVVAFKTSDTADCKIPFTVNFINQSQKADSYKWNFGDGTTDTSMNASHIYNSYKSFTVILTATNKNGCSSTFQKNNYIVIKKPVIKLNLLPDSSCAPFTKSFSSTITSVGTIATYLWNFGDGSTSTLPNPTYTYTAVGSYTVSLTISTSGGCTDSVKIVNAIVVTSKPVVNFTATPINTCAKTPVSFIDLSTGGATRWLWYFGDGTTSVLKNPIHKYVDTGYFDVKLIVWNKGCQDSLIYPKYVHISPPIARFLVKNDCSKPFERVLVNQSIGADEWLWDFGDGNTSTLQNPTYTYSSTGTFTIILTVKNNISGCDDVTSKTIEIMDIEADFIASDSIICKGSTVTFNSGPGAASAKSFNWSFGDGSPATLGFGNGDGIKHTYTKLGSFDVRYTIQDATGCLYTKWKYKYINTYGPTAKFGAGVPGACLNTAVIFKDSSISDGTNSIKNWTWNYGDSTIETLTTAPFQHSYSNAGIYTVSLKIIDSIGCADSFILIKPIIISQPQAGFSTTDTITCPGKSVSFINESTGPGLTYLWDFGDGSTTTFKNPAHSYAADGNYTIKLSIIDQYGCSDLLTKVNYISIVSAIANFTVSDSFSSCPPLLVNFKDLSANGISSKWEFGDTTSSTITDPSHFYTYPGTYVAKLTVTSPGGCLHEMTKTIVIQGPTGSFTYSPINGCKPLTVNFVAKNNGKVSYIWDFNDGYTNVTSDSIVSHIYTNPGKFRPKVILINDLGCQVPIRGADSIFVSDISANFHFSNKPLCDSGFISFTDSSVSNATITTYNWDFGDGEISTDKNPVHQYIDLGLYYPKLIATNNYGCVDSFTTAAGIKVIASPKIKMTTSANGCTPLTMNFNGIVAVPDTSAITWNWTMGNGNSSVLQKPNAEIYTTAGVYTINLLVTNSSGCIDTLSKNIEAYIIPTVDAGVNSNLCIGSSTTLNASGADSYNWSPAAALNCIDCQNTITSTKISTTYFVKGTTVDGCSAVDSVKITVIDSFAMKVSPPVAVCKGDSKKLAATGANSYDWTPSISLDNPKSSTPTATPDITTNYRVVGSDAYACFKDTGYLLMTVNPLPTVNAGVDKTINSGGGTDLIPVISADVNQVIWSPTEGLFRNIYPGITVKPKENTEYTVEVKNNKGCSARDKVTVFVICNNGNVFIPNTFSPNADGSNDIFYPRGTGLFKVKMFRIFNRWGEQVFQKESFDANDPSSGWDGTYKGTKLNADVFVYVIDIICSNNSVLTFKGNIALIQ